MQSGLKFQPTRILSKAGAEKISSATIETQLQAKQQALSSANLANKENGADQDDQKAGSRLDLVKPSMMSVAESHGANEEDQDKVSDGDKKTAFGLSAFKATQSGISQASLCFGKSIHNSNFKNVARSTINTVANHVDAMPMPKKF